MTAGQPDEETQRFIEEIALLFEQAGHARMAGRILAWLMICDPPYQTAGQIAAALQASKASISTNVRMFVDFGLVERFTRPPDRRDYYRLGHDVWPKVAARSIPLLDAFVALADRGLRLLEGGDDELRHRVGDMRDFYVFYAGNLRETLARWQREHGDGGGWPG